MRGAGRKSRATDKWGQSEVIGIAKVSCTFCHGKGMRPSRYGAEVPCACASRAAFRACWNRFRECAAARGAGRNSMEGLGSGTRARRSYGRKNEEFMADFCLVSRRVLDDLQYAIFQWHYVLGWDWRACCEGLRISRGEFFHELYRIEGRLGRAFAEVRPYALYPLADYFCGSTLDGAEAAVAARAMGVAA